ncbi:hypothetical protein M422DRAFT_254939 [Sphaerobolus stellatus SS14]|uniref:CCHC-type domain-containing protein n=1 Tax=Sphaerobolus stellatus (strain SS14) TaxID=990650 RepID=A0A0C9V530_SPHS4|nr:hypothetical protein M422DRAFT_254939 [Sphaerobolus stellatus SS14]
MCLSLPLESPFLDKEDDIDELDLDTLVIDDETAERRRESIHQNIISCRHRRLYHIILMWLEELDPTLYPPRALRTIKLSYSKIPPTKTHRPGTFAIYTEIRADNTGSLGTTTFLRAWPVPQWVTEYFELDTSLSTLTPSPPSSLHTLQSPASPYPSPPLSPLFHTPPSSPLASPTATPSLIPTMATAVPMFSGGMKENGGDWLKEIKAHFTDTRIITDQARCEYFELKLRLDAARRFKELPDAIRTDWKLLEAKWKKMYPARNAYLNTARDIDEFYDLRISDKDLSRRPTESNEGESEWAIAQFVEKLQYLGTKVADASETSKGRHVFRHLPPLVRDRLPSYGAQGPRLKTLCADLAALDHPYIAKLAMQQERIQHQLDSIARFSTQTNARPQRAGPTPRQTLPNFSSTAFPPSPSNTFTPSTAFNTQTDSQARTNRPFRPIGNSANFVSETSKTTNAPANHNFEATPDGTRQYEEAVSRWFTTYGADAIPNASRPFPLTPGSPSPGSGECWRCGHKGHYKESAECLRNNPLPDKEQQYRRIVGASILNTVRNVKSTAAFHIESGTFDEFNRNYAFASGSHEPQYEDYQDINPFLGNVRGDDL